MGTTLRALGPLEWELTVTLDGDQLDAEVARRLGELVPRARIPGFRPGKAPREVLRRHYGARLRQEQWQRMAHSEVRRELATRQLHPVTAPRLEPRENNGVCARFEVFPTLPELRFDQIVIERPIVEIGDADVDCLIDRLRADPSATDVEPSTLRAELAALMVAQAEEAVEEELALAVEIALLEAHPDLELPTTLLAAQVERLRGRDHGSDGTSGDEATIELAARRLLGSTLLLAEASRQLGVRLDPTELWKETEKLAARTPDPRQELDRLWADGEAIQEIEEQLLRRRVVAAILERARVAAVPVSFTALAQRRRARPGSAGR